MGEYRRHRRNFPDLRPVFIKCDTCGGCALEIDKRLDEIEIVTECQECAGTGLDPIPLSEMFNAAV